MLSVCLLYFVRKKEIIEIINDDEIQFSGQFGALGHRVKAARLVLN